VSAPTDRAGFRSDVRVISLIAAAHFFSHLFQLTLPPLFPLLKDVWGVPYVALGLAMSVFYGASGIGQTVSGFLVDRVGAHRVLLGGMALFSASVALAGLVPTYWLLLPVALLGASARRSAGGSGLEGLASPITHGAFAAVLLVSAALATLRGGLTWRDTFYPLALLRAGTLRERDLPCDNAVGW